MHALTSINLSLATSDNGAKSVLMLQLLLLVTHRHFLCEAELIYKSDANPVLHPRFAIFQPQQVKISIKVWTTMKWG